ncbi:MAG: hypothetical protein JXR70_18245 [Spirochaetales bacterium]|nr:hypothetical protein [Spirochaetales bacterium]
MNRYLISLLIIFINIFMFAETEAALDLNKYYQFPFSIAVEYQTLTPLSNYPTLMNIYQISGNFRYSLPFFPVLQPVIGGGIIFFDSRDPQLPERFDHSHIFGSAGLIFANRFAKNFELGLELCAGFSQSYFPHLISDYGTLGSPNLSGQAGLRISLVPSFNFTIDIYPNVKYLHSLGPLSDFNGFLIGLGFSGQFRFGDDPDSLNSLIRSILFEKLSFPPVFAAMQSYYARNPITSITISNSESQAISHVQVAFFQAGYMDAPTPSIRIEKILPQEKVDIDLFGLYNQQVFTTEGITPLTGEIIVTFEYKGRTVQQKQTVNYDLYDKTSVIWNDDRKASAYITPADSALRNYSSYIRKICLPKENPGLNQALQLAIEVYYSLWEIGLIYQADPISPFMEVQGNEMAVDSINLPRETLKRLTGDCDDLSVLFCSLMESQGVETALITIPGHIFIAINTKIESSFFSKIHPSQNMTISQNGELWIPIEITLLGKKDFLSAWRNGIEEYRSYNNTPLDRGFYETKTAQQIYRPVGLRETDLGLQYGNRDNILANFSKYQNQIIDEIIKYHEAMAMKTHNKNDYNTLGVSYARFNQYEKGKSAFDKALTIDPQFIKARINIANLFYLQGNYEQAANNYKEVIQIFERQNITTSSLFCKTLINLSQSYYEINDIVTAQKYFNQAALIDNKLAEKYSFLKNSIEASEPNRSLEYSNRDYPIFFAEETDE